VGSLEEEFARLDQYVSGRMAAARTPGMAVAFVDRRQCVRVVTYGVSSLETRAPVRPETLFRIGSITKSFTALATVQLAERGELDLHRPVTDYLPWWRVRTRFSPIALHHLLTHTAGIVTVIDRSPDQRGAVWALRETETAWEPGTRFHYSDAGYQTLALILARVTGVPFPEVIQRQIFAPLGMHASVASVTHDVRAGLATGYRNPHDDRSMATGDGLVPASFLEVEAGDCSIASTAEDMAAYARMLCNTGRGPHGTLLGTSWFDRLVYPHVRTGAGGTHYGYGLGLSTVDGRAHLDHGGGMPGFVAHLNVERDAGLGVVTLSTTPHVPGISWDLSRAWRMLSRGEPLDLPATPPARSGPAVSGTVGGEEGSTATRGEEGEPPAPWRAYPGHYRAHNPWATNFRVQLRGPVLWLVWPGGRAERLFPCDGDGADDGEFFAADPPTPERIRFDQLADGEALRAVLSGTDYYRFFTP
jgi:CubicO group peptidase (beta-lactamase class C family)